MRRTRKWSFVAQEATRLAMLGLPPVEIANRLSVKRSTVQRWMAAGKLVDTRRSRNAARPNGVTTTTKPEEWAAIVRRDYALDATDDQLVTMAEKALERALCPTESTTNQLCAMRTFQGLVKQLALVARQSDPVAAPQPEPKPERLARTGTDPRALLMAVK